MKKEVSEVFEKEQSNESCIQSVSGRMRLVCLRSFSLSTNEPFRRKMYSRKIEKCGLKLVRAFLNIDLLGGINYGEYRYAGLNSYNLQLIGKDKVDKNSFLHWKKNI